MGHISHIHEVLRQNVVLLTFFSAMESLERSQSRKKARSFARESIRLTDDDPQTVQRHLCRPEDVLPFLLILAPQSAHFGLFTPCSSPQTTSLAETIV